MASSALVPVSLPPPPSPPPSSSPSSSCAQLDPLAAGLIVALTLILIKGTRESSLSNIGGCQCWGDGGWESGGGCGAVVREGLRGAAVLRSCRSRFFKLLASMHRVLSC